MAKHYIARTVTETPAYMQAKIVVPAAETLHAGQVVVAEELDAGLGYGNWDVYTAGKVANIAKDNIAIILNGGFETFGEKSTFGNVLVLPLLSITVFGIGLYFHSV